MNALKKMIYVIVKKRMNKLVFVDSKHKRVEGVVFTELKDDYYTPKSKSATYTYEIDGKTYYNQEPLYRMYFYQIGDSMPKELFTNNAKIDAKDLGLFFKDAQLYNIFKTKFDIGDFMKILVPAMIFACIMYVFLKPG